MEHDIIDKFCFNEKSILETLALFKLIDNINASEFISFLSPVYRFMFKIKVKSLNLIRDKDYVLPFEKIDRSIKKKRLVYYIGSENEVIMISFKKEKTTIYITEDQVIVFYNLTHYSVFEKDNGVLLRYNSVVDSIFDKRVFYIKNKESYIHFYLNKKVIVKNKITPYSEVAKVLNYKNKKTGGYIIEDVPEFLNDADIYEDYLKGFAIHNLVATRYYFNNDLFLINKDISKNKNVIYGYKTDTELNFNSSLYLTIHLENVELERSF